MAHSEDLRRRVIKFIRQGGSKAEASRRYEIGLRTIYAWMTGATSAIMFTLVPMARIKKRLHVEEAFRDATRRLPGLILKYRRELLHG